MPQKQLSGFFNLPGRNAPGTDSENNVKKPLAKPQRLRDTPSQSSVSPRYHVTAQGIGSVHRQAQENNLGPIPAQSVDKHSGQQRGIAVFDRPVNVHVHLPGVRCPACEYLEIANMQDEFAALPFAEAMGLWLERHRPYISSRSHYDYVLRGNALTAFFGQLQLRHVNSATVRGYQFWRWKRGPAVDGETQGKYAHAADSITIKNEINSVLKPMLKEAGVWQEIERKKFKHLPVPREGAGIAMPKELWKEVFEIAFSQKRWHLAGHCLQIMFRAGVGFGELRKAKRADLDEKRGTIRVLEGAKNNTSRPRTVTLVPSALESAKWLLKRWERLGGVNPNSYLLPLRSTYHKGLDKPMLTISVAWKGIKAEFQKKHPDLNPRQYDARVSAATILLQNPELSLAVIEKALGWTPNSAMRKRYHRADHDALRAALNTLEDVG